MASSSAYKDYMIRMGEAHLLSREALRTPDARKAGALSKGASVLAAEALERYINDVVVECCAALKVERWDSLSEGQQKYMARQIARVLWRAAGPLHRKGDVSESRRRKLRKAVDQGKSGFESPEAWEHQREYGLFLEGAAEPDKVERVLREFDEGDRSFFRFVEERGRDRGALGRGLRALIDARHQAAHALRGTWAGPQDVRLWIGLSAILAREVEAYLGYRR